MKRMNLVMRRESSGSGSRSGSGSDNEDVPSFVNRSGDAVTNLSFNNTRKHECENCRAEFPNKTTMDRHMLFCRTLADIRRGNNATGSSYTTMRVSSTDVNDPLMPTHREMFILIQELALKYNKVKDELDVMKQWAKMVGRRVGGTGSAGNGGGVLTGLDFTSITRQKRQNMEVILNEEDTEHPELAELRPGFSEWLSSPALSSLTTTDLNLVFNEDIVAGITAAILRILAEYTAETGKSHLIPFKLADIRQGAFYIYDIAFKVGGEVSHTHGPDLPTFHTNTGVTASHPLRKWRAMEPCEFQLLVRTFHKLLFKEFKKWQDTNWEAQQLIMKQRQKAASTYQHMMTTFQCSPAMATCDGMYPPPLFADGGCNTEEDNEVKTPPVSDTVLSDEFAALYNKYADKMMGGSLSDDTILSRVRAKLWKDMKAWRL